MDELTRMATRNGFLEVFWRRLRELRRHGGTDTRKQLYYAMEAQYEATYGQSCFPSYEAFKKYMNRHSRSI